jgi:hypothetical protein
MRALVSRHWAILIDVGGILALCAFAYFLNLALSWAYSRFCP